MKCSQVSGSQMFEAARAGRGFRPFRALCAVAVLAAVAGLAGCGSSAPLFASDGRPTTLVQCTNGSDSCDQQAAASCDGAGYEVVRQTVESGVRNLLYACKGK
jgi:predicted small lipoprotein YifL